MNPVMEADVTAIEADVRVRLADVLDPEIPVLSIVDLGLIRHVRVAANGAVEVGVSPTYSGCPATSVIKADVEQTLRRGGYGEVRIVDVLAPPWTTEWITAEGRSKLHDYGIAPLGRAGGLPAVWLALHDEALRVRLHTLQGALSLHALPRAFRSLQVPLIRCSGSTRSS